MILLHHLFLHLPLFPGLRSRSWEREVTAEPDILYPEATALKSKRLQGAATLHKAEQDKLFLVLP
jgi:hypothetical protein